MAQQTDAELAHPIKALDGKAGCLAQETNDADDAWKQIGANWAVSRMLLNEFKAESAR